MPADEVLFDEASHTYTVNGMEYPSVSAVLSLFADYSRVPRAVLEFKRKIGKFAHRCIELYETGELDVDTVDEAVMPYLQSWMNFRTVKPLRVVAAEKIVYSNKYRYAGRLDLIVEFTDDPETLWLLDAKCVYAMDPATALQTAGYAEAFNENEEIRVKKRAGLQLKPDGGMAELYPYRNKTDFNIFSNALNLHHWMRNNNRRTA